MEFSDLLKFEKFLAPLLIRSVYLIVSAIIVITTVITAFHGGPFDQDYGMGGFSLLGAVVSLILGALALTGWRVSCELMIVIFSVNDRLGSLVELKKSELGKD